MASESKAREMARAQVLSWLEAHDWNVANACATMLWLSPDKAIELEREARREAFTEAARMARACGERQADLIRATAPFNLAHEFDALASNELEALVNAKLRQPAGGAEGKK